PFISYRQNRCGARKRSYSHYRMKWRCLISYQNKHRPPRDAFVGACPGMTEISPDVLQSETCVLAQGRRIDELQVRPHEGRRDSSFSFLHLIACERIHQLSAVAHQTKYGNDLVSKHMTCFHLRYELSGARL